MRRRSCSQGSRAQGDSGGTGSPSPIHSGPGQSRNWASNSRFLTEDPLRHGKSAEEPFTTFDFSKVNQDWHQWQRVDTFQTPTTSTGPLLEDMEDLSLKRGQCAMRADVLGAFRDEILEGCRADLHSVVTLVRQEVDRSIRQIIVQVKRTVRDQNADSLNLLAEMGRVRSAECDLSEVLKEVQEGRQGEAAELLDGLAAVRGGVEASSEGLQSVKSSMSSLVVRQGNVEEGVAEMNTAVRRVMDEVAEIRKVKTELEFRNVREKKIEAEVADILREVKELKTSFEGLPVRQDSSSVAKGQDLEARLRGALAPGEHLAALRREVREALRRLAGELDERGGTAVAGAMEAVSSTLQAQLADVVREVRRVKADVDLKIIRKGATSDVKVFVSTAPREEEGPEEEAACPAGGIGLGGAAASSSAQKREGEGGGCLLGRSGASLASSATSAGQTPGAGQELSVSSWTDAGAGEDPRGPPGRPSSASREGGGGRRRPGRTLDGSSEGLAEADVATLRAAFERADVNGSGSISMVKTVNALRVDERFAELLGFDGTVWVRPARQEDVMRLFNRVDSNGDSGISWQELKAAAARRRRGRAALAAAPPGREPPPPEPPAARGASEDSESSISHEEEYHGSVMDGRVFDRAISRARQAVSHARGAAAAPGGREGRSSDELAPEEKASLRAMFDRVDANGSGKISMAETIHALKRDERFARILGFEAPFRVRQEGDGTRDAFCRAFQQVDSDGDKNITWEELLAFARAQRSGHAHGRPPPADGPGRLEDGRA